MYCNGFELIINHIFHEHKKNALIFAVSRSQAIKERILSGTIINTSSVYR